MEALTRQSQTLGDLLSRARSQVQAVEALSQVLATEKEGLRRLRWAAQLDAVRDQVKREVEAEQTEEYIAGAAFSQWKMTDAIVPSVVEITKAMIGEGKEKQLVAGLRQACHCLGQTAPFGTITVSVGSRGLFDDVRVLSISRLAREQRRPELDVIAIIKAKGSELLTPDAFSGLIEDRCQRVLDGSSAIPPGLPVSESHPRQRIAPSEFWRLHD